MSFVGLWARAFVLTLGTELLVAPWFMPRTEPRWRRFGAVVAANVLSHPAVWFVFPELRWPYLWFLLTAELWAFLSEVCLYSLVFPELRWRRAIVASALANGASVGAGYLLRALGVTV